MCTTTEPRSPLARRAMAGARFGLAGVGVVAAWFVLLGAAARWLEPTDEVLVFMPGERVAAVLSRAPVRALDAPGGVLKVRGDAPGFVGAMYAAGATWVLPAAGPGCRGALLAAARR